jgi:hypothetical protein
MISVISNILKILTDPKNLRTLLVIVIGILIFLLMQQCEKTKAVKEDVTRIKNNAIALQDTVRNYKDKWGNSVGEIKGLKLTLKELSDSFKYAKNRPPITIIEVRTEIVERIKEVPVYIKDTLIIQDTLKFESELCINESDTFGKSSRSISIGVPFSVREGLKFGKANIELKQNIWLSASISQDKKTKEVFVQVKSDYPNATFNNIKGILIDQNSKEFKALKNSHKKSFGLGINLGIGYMPLTNSFGPYLGVGVSYTPKFLQW